MVRKIVLFLATLALMFSFGCSSTMENVNKGAEKAGEAGGQVMRVPGSVSEGGAKGIAGEEKSNPYNR